MKSLFYRAAAGLVGFGCVIGFAMLIWNWKGWSGSVAFALVNLAAAAWFLLDYALRRPAESSRSGTDSAVPQANRSENS